MKTLIKLCAECTRLAQQANGGAWIVPSNCACEFIDQKPYICEFYGRLNGAIGIRHPCRVTVNAETEEAARITWKKPRMPRLIACVQV